MDLTNWIILIGAAVLLVSVMASLVSSRVGLPLLLVFLVLGMLLGPEGPGGFVFADIQSAHLIGSLALAIILFDGGLRTRAERFDAGLRPAAVLATFGVVVTAFATGLFAAWLLDLGRVEGLLIGAIVGSTDAAAVFSLLHSRGLEIKRRVAATLEIESGANDPMAIFLTVVLIEVLLAGDGRLGFPLIFDFAWQMGLGGAAGVLGGLLLVRIINRVDLSPGLYPLAALSGGLTLFGLTAVAGGSGFLAVYLAGVVLGNRPMQASHNIRRFHDGFAWLSQIGMFLMLGMLVVPSELPAVALDALLIAAVLIFVARPIAVLFSLPPFRFPWRDQTFIAWVGLRGAVPIILALFPLLAGVENAQQYFNIAFFVVLVSLVVQGWTIAPMARLLRLEVPPQPHVVQRIELDIPGQHELELLGYRLTAQSPVVRENWHSFVLPEGAKLAAIIRGGRPVEVCGFVDLEPGDYLYVLAPDGALAALDRLFVAEAAPERLRDVCFFGEFALNGEARLSDLVLMYGIVLPAEHADEALADYMARQLRTRPDVGDRVAVGGVQLVVREVVQGRIASVGLKLGV